MTQSSELRAGEWVQVRSKKEIFATLDNLGQLEGLPFMPEMFDSCGKRFQVFKRAHKTCDPPNGLGGRRMLRTVHLTDVRCDGAAHGGCQAGCLVFWKEAWLQRADGPAVETLVPLRPAVNRVESQALKGCTEAEVFAATRGTPEPASPDEPVFVCQSTQLSQATQHLPWWDFRQYAEDYTSGNVRLSQLLAAFLFFVYEHLVAAGLGLGAALRWLYDAFQKVRGGSPYPCRVGKIPRGAKTPAARLDLRPGDLVKVRRYDDILETLDEDSQNRGMWFDAEMVPFCGGTYRVHDRISRIINEKTGKMQHLKNSCITLDGVVCRACYAKYRRFCPRSIFPYWREIWLERVGTEASGNPKESESQKEMSVSS